MILSLEQIQQAARADRIKWHYHSLLRARERGITRQQALQGLHEGEILEQHPWAEPHPKCLMMALVRPDKPLYVALAYDSTRDYLHIITVHWIDPDKWEDPWTRKPKKTKLRKDKRP